MTAEILTSILWLMFAILLVLFMSVQEQRFYIMERRIRKMKKKIESLEYNKDLIYRCLASQYESIVNIELGELL